METFWFCVIWYFATLAFAMFMEYKTKDEELGEPMGPIMLFGFTWLLVPIFLIVVLFDTLHYFFRRAIGGKDIKERDK